ncbi:MAG: aromatic ring-hydroxylating oxygenase subunit alpha, partial [Gemmataceae bacterium]
MDTTDFDATRPLERAHTLPARYYWDPSIYAAEREAIFARTWQVVARADQLQAPGAFITLELAGEPLLLVRGEDGVLRGFYNVCRHRAAPILTEPNGCVNKLRCHYHGWTYDLTGKLRGTPEFDGVADFCKDTSGLVPIAVDTLGPLVAVHLEPPREPLAEFLAPLPAWALEQQPWANMEFESRRTYDLKCNWK